MQLEALGLLLHLVTMRDDLERWVWSLQKSREFSVASTHYLVDLIMLSSSSIQTRWDKTVPIKVNLFVWRLFLDRHLIRLNISRSGMDISYLYCVHCNNGVEFFNHLFFSYSLTSALLDRILRWWVIDVSVVFSFDDWSCWIVDLCLRKGQRICWKVFSLRCGGIFGFFGISPCLVKISRIRVIFLMI